MLLFLNISKLCYKFCILFIFQLDTTLQMIMNENSMDYVSKFAELAEKVAASDATVANSNAAAAVLVAKNGAKNNDVTAQDNVNCTNTDDCMTQLNDTFH